MAELSDPTPATISADTPCCGPEVQRTCCEPSEKAACCDTAAAGGTCGCAAGVKVDPDALRETVRKHYAAAAVQVVSGEQPSDCCGPDAAIITDEHVEQFGTALYAAGKRGGLQTPR